MDKEQFTFFYNGPFSQWAQAPFTINGIHYKTAEHYMMWYKDQIFDGALEKQILECEHPRDAKKLGRLVRNFDIKIWNAVAKQGVFYGNVAKFIQNKSLLYELIETKDTTLVEASPYDVIWGIGLSENDPLRFDRANWRGTNWLGEVLTEVRNICYQLLEEKYE